MTAKAESAGSPERDWWLRVLVVLQAPRAVFAQLRDDSEESASARAEPVLAIVCLAGIGGVLMTNVAGHVLDDFEIDGLLLVVWAFIAGLIHGGAVYFAVGALVYLGEQLADGLGGYRQARHILAFAAVPIALSLAIWPVRLALYGSDNFRSHGSDSGSGGHVFEGLELAFLGWSLALLVLGVRTVNGWSWPRALAASAVPAAVPALALARAYGLI